MSFSSTTSFSGQAMTSTLDGQIRIETGSGKMIIQDQTTLVELVKIDNTGFLFNDGTDRRIKLGSYATRVGLWISKDGIDVIDELGG